MDDKEKKIIVVDQDGSEKEAEVLNVFKLKSNESNYMLYTLNETDEAGMVKIYASRMVEKDGMYSFETIEDDSEWVQVKEAMKEIAKLGKEQKEANN